MTRQKFPKQEMTSISLKAMRRRHIHNFQLHIAIRITSIISVTLHRL